MVLIVEITAAKYYYYLKQHMQQKYIYNKNNAFQIEHNLLSGCQCYRLLYETKRAKPTQKNTKKSIRTSFIQNCFITNNVLHKSHDVCSKKQT